MWRRSLKMSSSVNCLNVFNVVFVIFSYFPFRASRSFHQTSSIKSTWWWSWKEERPTCIAITETKMIYDKHHKNMNMKKITNITNITNITIPRIVLFLFTLHDTSIYFETVWVYDKIFGNYLDRLLIYRIFIF